MEVIEQQMVYFEKEIHYKIIMDNKEIWVSKYEKQNKQFNDYDQDVEIIKGGELLNEEETEKVIEYFLELD